MAIERVGEADRGAGKGPAIKENIILKVPTAIKLDKKVRKKYGIQVKPLCRYKQHKTMQTFALLALEMDKCPTTEPLEHYPRLC